MYQQGGNSYMNNTMNRMNQGNQGMNQSYNSNSEMNFAVVNPNAPKLVDSVSDIVWIPVQQGYIFACGTWEGTVRVYSVIIGQNSQIGLDFVFGVNVLDPVLSIECRPDGLVVYCGLANGSIVEVDLGSKNIRQIGSHDLGVKNVFWNSSTNNIVTMGFDKMIRFWDVQQNQSVKIEITFILKRPVFEHKTENIPLVAAQCNTHFAYADNEQKIYEVDWEKLRNSYNQVNRTLFTSTSSALGDRSQISSMDLSPFYIAIVLNYIYNINQGSIDGRVNIQELSKYSTHKHVITFKAHKQEEQVGAYTSQKKSIMYPVNGMQFNPQRAPQNWLLTVGSDCELIVWDFKEKNKIKFQKLQSPLTCAKLSPDGNIAAFSIGNDWHRGLDSLGKYQHQIGAYAIPNNELKYIG